MNRRLWTAVAVTITVMSGISFVWGPGQLEAGLRWVGTAVTTSVTAIEGAPWPTVAGAAVVAALAGLATLRSKRRRLTGEREPWRTVIEMGKRGQSPSAIARRTGLPQDAVRIVLAPVEVDPAFPRGKSFRSSSPAPARPPRSDSQGRRP